MLTWRNVRGNRALGIKSLANLTMEEARHVSIDYTMHAASVLTQELAQPGKPFRFAYLSGVMAEKDQEKSLWFMGEARRMRVSVPLLGSLSIPTCENTTD